MLRSDPALAELPIIMLTGHKDHDTIRRCIEMCIYYVEKSVDTWQRVAPIVEALFGDSVGETPLAMTSSQGAAVPQRDPMLDAIFGALGMDEEYLAGGDCFGRMESTTDDSTSVSNQATDMRPWVLHVDDDAQFRDVVRLRLEASGFRVVSAFDGTAGIREAFTQTVSAIILDYEMPNGHGDYVLGRLKNNPVTKDIPVIVLTGVKDKFLERRLISQGASKFFNKPPIFDLLIGELQLHACHPVG